MTITTKNDDATACCVCEREIEDPDRPDEAFACNDCGEIVCTSPDCYGYEGDGGGAYYCMRCARIREGRGTTACVKIRWSDLGHEYFEHPTDDCTETWSENAASALGEWIEERIADEYPKMRVVTESVWDSYVFVAEIAIDANEKLPEHVAAEMTAFADRLGDSANDGDRLRRLDYDSGTAAASCALSNEGDENAEAASC